jgi:hypothetical protein
LQEALPHSGALQKAASPLQRWNDDDVEARSFQQAVVKHQHAVPASASFSSSALQLQGALHEAARRGRLSDSAGNDSPAPYEAIDDFSKGYQVEHDKVGGGEGESTQEPSNDCRISALVTTPIHTGYSTQEAVNRKLIQLLHQ